MADGNDAKYTSTKGGHALASDISDYLLKEAKDIGYIAEYKKENADAAGGSTCCPRLAACIQSPGSDLASIRAIRQVQPERLYVAADGPRPYRLEEGKKCEEVRKIVAKVDWACEVKTLFRLENLGCKQAVSSALL
jgi:hypothetical protein